MNGVQTRFKCKLDVKRCKRFVFPPSSLLPRSNALKTKAIRYFQTDRTLTRIVFSPPYIAQEGQISGNLVIQFYLALIIQFHDGKQRSRSLGQRSQIKKVRRTDSSGILIRVGSEAFVIYRQSVFPHQHAATGISSRFQSLPATASILCSTYDFMP